MKANLPVPSITIEVRYSEKDGTLYVVKIDSDGYSMDSDGNITLLRSIEMGGHGIVRFRLSSESRSHALAFVGLRIAETEAALSGAAILLDTREEYFAETPFKVSHERMEGGSTLTLWNFPYIDEHQPVDDTWFYTVGVTVNGTEVWLDPRIHNKGENQGERAAS